MLERRRVEYSGGWVHVTERGILPTKSFGYKSKDTCQNGNPDFTTDRFDHDRRLQSITRIAPRASAGLRMFAASMLPPAD
jgi:hypothetical protein